MELSPFANVPPIHLGLLPIVLKYLLLIAINTFTENRFDTSLIMTFLLPCVFDGALILLYYDVGVPRFQVFLQFAQQKGFSSGWSFLDYENGTRWVWALFCTPARTQLYWHGCINGFTSSNAGFIRVPQQRESKVLPSVVQSLELTQCPEYIIGILAQVGAS